MIAMVALFAIPAGPGLAGTARRSSQRGQASARVQPRAQDGLESLRERINAHINQSRFDAARWGIKVASLDTGKTLFELNARKYFYPASNCKLYSAALALDRLGADFRIKTSLYSTGRPDDKGVLKGDLLIYGRGDPTFAASLNGGDYYKPLEPLADAVAAAKVKRIQGDLIGDESFLRGPPFGSGWEWDDLQWYYGAEVSALSVNDNSVDLMVKPAERAGIPCKVTTGPQTPFVTIINRTVTMPKGTPRSLNVYRPVAENIIYVSGRFSLDDPGYTGYVAVHNPAGMFATLFKEVLERRGITVTGRARSIDWKYREVTPIELDKLIEIGSVESPPLSDILRETLKPSRNLYAQLLLLQVGAAVPRLKLERERKAGLRPLSNRDETLRDASAIAAASAENQTAEESALDELRLFLSEIGIKRGDVLLEEGAGLSRRNLVTPDATVALLTYLSRHGFAAVYRDALPIAGVDGSLKNRMKETAAASNVRAKTGTLRYVSTLSGYVTTLSGERLVFSIMLNDNYNADGAGSSRDDVDPIAVMLAGFGGHS